MLHFVGFDNHLPFSPVKTSLDDETTVYDVGPEGCGTLEHLPQLDFVEPAVLPPFLNTRLISVTCSATPSIADAGHY